MIYIHNLMIKNQRTSDNAASHHPTHFARCFPRRRRTFQIIKPTIAAEASTHTTAQYRANDEYPAIPDCPSSGSAKSRLDKFKKQVHPIPKSGAYANESKIQPNKSRFFIFVTFLVTSRISLLRQDEMLIIPRIKANCNRDFAKKPLAPVGCERFFYYVLGGCAVPLTRSNLNSTYSWEWFMAPKPPNAKLPLVPR